MRHHEFPDALVDGRPRGRGAGLNPVNRFEPVRLHVLGEHLDRLAGEGDDGSGGCGVGPPRPATTVIGDQTRTLINYVDPRRSPDIGFRWTINPYRGCEHGCIYCYARPDHERLGMSSGLDFETRIVAKRDSPELLRRELASPRWAGEPIVLAGVTDIYQPIERELRVTRGLLEVMVECRQPVSLITKSRLIVRDLDLLRELRRWNGVHAAVSVTTLDVKLAARMEPRASSPRDRLRAIEALDAGATSAGWVMLRLPHQIKALFLDWLSTHYPERAGHVESLLRQVRGGELYDARPGLRQRGEGPVAAHLAGVFKVFARRYALDQPFPSLSSAHFRPPTLDGQGRLFD
jgi:DNA repair photolyase